MAEEYFNHINSTLTEFDPSPFGCWPIRTFLRGFLPMSDKRALIAYMMSIERIKAKPLPLLPDVLSADELMENLYWCNQSRNIDVIIPLEQE